MLINGIVIEDHRGLVAKFVQRYRHRFTGTLELDDLIQAGMIGLIRAAERFRPELGCQFSTYSRYWIRHEINRSIQDEGRTVRIPVHIQDAARKQKETLPVASSLDVRVAEDGNMTRLDLVTYPADDSEEPLDHARMLEALETLPAREADVLRSRYLRGECLREIGERYGVSTERIRQIETKALEKLRKALSRRKPKPVPVPIAAPVPEPEWLEGWLTAEGAVRFDRWRRTG